MQFRHSLLVAPLLAGPVLAQNINIDFGTNLGTPSNAHAAAGQPGFWNPVAVPVNASLRDLDGNLTSAHVTTQFSDPEFNFDSTATEGESEALLDDAIGDQNTILFSGLENGSYRVLTYAWAPDDPSLVTIVGVVGSSDPQQWVGFALWEGTYVHLEHYADHAVEVDDGTLAIGISTANFGTTCNGVQLIKEDVVVGSSFCTAAENSVTEYGSRISATGSTSLATENLKLFADNAPALQPAIFYLGSNQINVPFGDGFRCVDGNVVRLPVIFASGGGYEYPVDFDEFGAVLASLGTVQFQCWYRDGAAGGATFNLSDGLELTFTP